MEISIPSRRKIKIFRTKFEKMLMVVHLPYLGGKAVVDELLFGILQPYAKLLLGLMIASYTPTRRVSPCYPVIVRVAISIQRQVDSHRGKKGHSTSELWSYLMFKE